MNTIAELIQQRVAERAKLDEVIRKLEEALAAERAEKKQVNGKKTILEMAAIIVAGRQHAMKPQDVSEGIQRKFDVCVNPRSLGSMMYHSSQNGANVWFKDKKTKNTYGLLNWNREVAD